MFKNCLKCLKITINSNLENLKSWCCNLEVLKSWLVQSWFKISRLQDQDFKTSSFRESWICNPNSYCYEMNVWNYPHKNVFLPEPGNLPIYVVRVPQINSVLWTLSNFDFPMICNCSRYIHWKWFKLFGCDLLMES